jgi:hypothetical protein
MELVLSIPPLRATLFDQIRGPMRILAEAVAERTRRQPDDLAVRALAGAVIGVGLSAMFAAADDPDADIISLIDTMMAQLEAGCPSSGASHLRSKGIADTLSMRGGVNGGPNSLARPAQA